MSRIGKKPIVIPDKVKVEQKDAVVTVQGPKGMLEHRLPKGISMSIVDKVIEIKRENDQVRARSLHGLTRTLISNMVHGVTEGFEKKLEISGLGLKAQAQGQVLNLSLGFSHPVKFELPKGVQAKVEANTKITLSGADKELVGRSAAEIRKLRPPEPYKLTGIKYAGEKLTKKAGKTTGAAGA